MDIKINIPGYPDCCRICLIQIDKSASCISIENQLSDGACYWEVLQTLSSLYPGEAFNKNDKDENTPQYICSECAHHIESLWIFNLEVNANQRLLNAWIAYQYRADCEPLRDLLHNQTQYHGTIRKTLRRLDVLENDDISLTSLMQELKGDDSFFVELELKTEPVENEDSLQESLSNANKDDEFDDTKHQTYENKEDLLVDKDVNKLKSKEPENTLAGEPPRKKKIRRVCMVIDGIRARPCYLENCEPIPVGQADKHSREKHRAYCKLCGLVFASHTQTVRHWAIHKSEEDRFRCEICGKPYWREQDLKLHRRNFHGVDVANYECPYCEERFERRVDMMAHRDLHTSCKFCPEDFDSYRLLMEHTREMHRNELFQCKSCRCAFFTTTDLELHDRQHVDGRMENCIQFVLKNWTPANCLTCERDLFNHEYLQRHIEKEHAAEMSEKPPRNRNFSRRTKEELAQLEYKFQCSDCPAKFRIKTSLKCHWMKNHSGKKFVCVYCGLTFKSKPHLSLHERYLHTKLTPYPCDQCEKRCHSKNDLMIHKRSHSNEKPYKCWHEGCDKAYKTRSAVMKHFLVHTGEKPYKCSYEGCDKSYACSQLLKVHVRVHTLEKPFKCYYCDLYFNSTKNRSKHCHRHHPGLPIGRMLEKQNRQKEIENNANARTQDVPE